jgi:hypothetical protein
MIMSKSKKVIWDCLDKFAGDTLPRRYSDTKDPSEMTPDEYDDYVAGEEFRADCEKDDKMMDGITDNEREWTK